MNPAAATPAALRAPPRWSLRRLWLLALPLSALWFGFWGLLWQPETFIAPRENPLFTPHARFLPARAPADGGEPQSDLRVMWSPVLFALPTPMGFSRAPAAGDGHDRPRVQRPTLEPQLMPPPPVAKLAAVVPVPRLPALNDGANFYLDGAAPVFAALPGVTPTLSVEVLGALAGLRCLDQPLPPLPVELAAESWTVVATLELGRAGRVQHVFLDPPSASAAFNAQLLQAFFRWRFAPSAAAVQGLVHLHHAPAPQVPKPKLEEAAP
jgi:hypothetical protein